MLGRTSLVASALVLACACQAPAGTGAGCARNTDCVAPLACTYGRCREQCASARDCSTGLRCVATATGLGVCTLPPEERCTSDVCTAPLVCVADQCRTTCATDADCHAGTCSSGSCVEPTQTIDAGAGDTAMPESDAGLSCDTSAWPIDHTPLGGLFADTLTGPAGFRALTPAIVGPFATPTEGGIAIAGQLALAAHADATRGHAWVGWLEDAARTLHALEVALDDPNDSTSLDLDGGVVTGARSLDFGVDGTSFVGVVARAVPTPSTDPFAWVIDEDAPTRWTGLAAPTAFATDGVFGRAGVTGGLSAFGGSASAPVRFVLSSGDVLRVLDRTLAAGSALTTTAPAGFVDGAGSSGQLYVFGDAADASAQVWNVTTGRDASATPVASSTDGAPAIAVLAADPTQAIVAYPTGRTVTLRTIDCTADCVVAGAMHGITPASIPVTHVALATLGSGVVLATAYSDGSAASTALTLDYVGADGTPSRVERVWAGPTLTGQEQIVDLRVAASPGPLDRSGARGAGIMVAVLVRDSGAMQDRIWLGGVYGCAP